MGWMFAVRLAVRVRTTTLPNLILVVPFDAVFVYVAAVMTVQRTLGSAVVYIGTVAEHIDV